MSNPSPNVTMTVGGATSEISSPTESSASTATSSASSDAAASSSSALSLASSLRDPPVLLSDGRVIPQSRCHFAWRRAVCVPEGGPSVLREWHSRNVRNLLQRVHGEQLGKATASLAKVAAVDAYTEAADVESIARLRTALERLKSTCAELDAALASRGVSLGRDHAPPAPAQASDALKAERAAEAERFKAAGGEVRKGVDGSMHCIRTVEDIWRAAGIPLTAQAADPSSPVERSDVASAADPRIPSAEPVSNAPVGVRPRPPTSQSPRGNAIWHADRDARGLSLTLPLLRERSKDLAQLLHSFDSAASDAPLQSLLLRCADDCRESSAALAAHGWSEADY